MEKVHDGEENNTVVYIPAGPDCAMNRAYSNKMRKRFEVGATPPDLESYGNTGTVTLCSLAPLVIVIFGVVASNE